MLTAPGDGVIVNPPVYPPFFADITHTGRTLVEVPLLRDGASGRRRDRGRVRRGRAGAACSPTRTTRPGASWTRDELSAVAAAAEAHDAWVLSDEIHAPLVFDGIEFTPYLSVSTRGRGADVGLEGVQPGGPEARDHRRRARRPAAAGDELARGLPGRRRGRGGVHATATSGWTRRARRSSPTTRTWRPSCRRGSRTRCRRRATWRGWTAARRGLGDDPARAFLERGRVALSRGLDFGAQGAGFARLNVGTTPELVEEAVRRLAAALTR